MASGEWTAVDYSVFRVAATPASWKQRLMAACLAGPAVASHRSAGLFWNFPAMPKEMVEVTALREGRRSASDVIWHESFHLTERDVTEIDGIPVTRPVRTFLDLAVVLDAETLEEVLDDGRNRRLFAIPSIWRRWEQLGPLRHGAGKVKALLERHTIDSRPAQSVLETRFRQVVRDAGLTMPIEQFEIRVGDFTYRIDFANPDHRLAIELLGERYHSGERVERDRVRQNRLGTLRWIVLEITWGQLHRDPEAVVATLRDALEPAA